MSASVNMLLSCLGISFIVGGIQTIQFSFISSPNITILQSAVYQCTVTGVSQNDDIAIRWDVNGVSSSSPSEWIPYVTSTGVKIDGTETDTTLTIPGNTALTLTILVECIASGVANGVGYYNTNSDVLYIQDEIHNNAIKVSPRYEGSSRIARFMVMNPQLSSPHEPILLIMTTSQSPSVVPKTYNTTNITIIDSVIMGEIVLDPKENKQINATITLEYGNGINISSADNIEINTFGVQDFNIINSTDSLCCQCSFITANYVKRCFVQYKCTQTLFNGHFNINETEQEQCVEDIYTSVYNITVYDIESDGTVRMDQPVFKINDVSVTGILYTSSTVPTLTRTTPTTTPTTTTPTTTPTTTTPTTTPTTPTTTPTTTTPTTTTLATQATPAYLKGLLIAAVTSITVIMLLGLLIVILLFVLKHFWSPRNKPIMHLHVPVDTKTNIATDL